MIKIQDTNGQTHYLAAAAIASIAEAGTSSQWHGTRAIVRLFDGCVIEARDTAEEIAARIAKESGE